MNSDEGARRPTVVRYHVLVLLALAAFINYLHRHPLSIAEEAIQEELGLTLVQMGWLMGGAFKIPYAACQVFTGWLGYRWGSRKALSLYAATWSSFTGLIATAGGFVSLLTFRFGMGASQSGFLPCAVNSVAHWFPHDRRATASGILSCTMALGGAAAAILTGVLLTHVGWRSVFAIYAVPGLLWSAWFFYWFRDRPEAHRSTNQAEIALIRGGDAIDDESDSAFRRVGVPWSALACNSAVWALSTQQLLRGFGYVFLVTWFPRYLGESQGVTEVAERGRLAFIVLLADVLGRLVGGIVSDWVFRRTRSRRVARSGVASLSLTCCAAVYFCVPFVEGASVVTSLVATGAFFAGVSSPCSNAATIEIGLRYTAVVFAVMNAIGSLDGFSPVAVAWLVEDHGVAWRSIPFFFGGVYILAAISWALLDPNQTLQRDQSGD